MQENIKKNIILHNNKTYHLSYNSSQKDNIIYAIDYIKDVKIGDKVPLKIIYDNQSGVINKDIYGICVDTNIKGVKTISFKFKRRQNYSRTVGSSQLFTYLQLGGI